MSTNDHPKSRIRLSARIDVRNAYDGSLALGSQRHGTLLLVNDINNSRQLAREWIPSEYQWDPECVNQLGELGAYSNRIPESEIVEAATRLIEEFCVTEQNDRRLGSLGVQMIMYR